MSQQATAKNDSRGYRESFKASAVLGGSQAFTYVLGILRTKALAYLLGPAGIGLVGLYTSILNAGLRGSVPAWLSCRFVEPSPSSSAPGARLPA